MRKLSKEKTKQFSGFTLVELIVVITILAILGTIAFLSLGGYSASARDSVRIENLSNLQKGLSIFQIKSGSYPMPEGAVNITASGTIIWYQGFAKDQIGSIANISKWWTVDPADAAIYTTYSVNAIQGQMQLMAFLEDGGSVTSYIPNTFAASSSDYSKRTPSSKWDSLGILLGNSGATLNQPVQESGTGVDVINTQTGYVMYLSTKEKYSWSGAVLKAGVLWSGLTGYWDMETTYSAGGITYMSDLSSSKNDGEGSGAVVIGGTGWKLGKATYFDGANNWIGMKKPSIVLLDKYAIAGWINPAVQTNLDVFYSEWTPATTYQLGLVWNENYKLSVSSWNKSYPGNWISSPRSTQSYQFPLNSWTHFALVFNGGKLQIYINGNLIETVVSQIENHDITATSGKATFWVNVGAKYGWGQTVNYFKGLLDEMSIYNRAISSSEVQTLYNATR